ncbi:glutamate decarboxylase gad1 [Rhizina undulata]
MSLSKHVDPDELLASLRQHPDKHTHTHVSKRVTHHYTYGSRYASSAVAIPKFSIPHQGTDAVAVHQLIKDELDLDGRPNLNLASFVNTFMESQADQLMLENISKNLADADEYPALMAMHSRCVSMIAHLWGAPKGSTAIGTATTGSSEGIMLGGLAMKRRWQEKRRAEGKDTSNPNILMGANAQVALEKFARYFEVEPRILPVSPESHYCLDPKLVKENVDENTIGVFVILGSTYTGHFEPVETISKILDEYEAETGISIPIHVDGASGAMVAPFVGGVEGKWDFRLERVCSINTSGHKFGLVYPGLGWILWRDESLLPKDLVFELHYLGGTEETYTLNFSRPGAQVVAQYFNFLHLGLEGYRSIMKTSLENARILSKALERSGWYFCLSDIHRRRGVFGEGGLTNSESESSTDDIAKRLKEIMTNDNDTKHYNPGLPVVAFRLSDQFREEYPHVKQASVSTLLRTKGYIIPNYALPPNMQEVEILRVVVRESMNGNLLDQLICDILGTTETLMKADAVDLESLASPRIARIERRVQTMGKDGKQPPNNQGTLKTTC